MAPDGARDDNQDVMRRLFALFTLLSTIFAGACASTGAVPRPFPTPGGPAALPAPPEEATPPVPATPPSAEPGAAPGVGYGLAGTALSYQGVPYRNGGTDPAGGFDCSGFVWYVFARHGISVPRTVTEQYRAGMSVAPNELQPGDLVFFNTTGASPSHVGISIGGEQFVHAPSSTGEVRVERLGTSYWAGRLVGVRRVD
jgi:cell wall-associated NlpC family hydrolase